MTMMATHRSHPTMPPGVADVPVTSPFGARAGEASTAVEANGCRRDARRASGPELAVGLLREPAADVRVVTEELAGPVRAAVAKLMWRQTYREGGSASFPPSYYASFSCIFFLINIL